MIWVDNKIRRRLLRKDVQEAYKHVMVVVEPDTLDPDSPGHPPAQQGQSWGFREYVTT